VIGFWSAEGRDREHFYHPDIFFHHRPHTHMYKRSKQLTWMQKFATVGLILTAVQVGLLLYFRWFSRPLTAREALDKALEQSKVEDPRRRILLTLQVAVQNFRSTNKALPTTLQELIPTYFDFIPTDPNTNKSFSYRLDGKKFFIGEEGSKKLGGPTRKGMKNSPPDPQDLLINSITSGNEDKFIYDPRGKRDPFVPFNFSPQVNTNPHSSPLQKYSLSQLKLTAVLEGFGEPAAIVETVGGLGFTVKKGTKIGPNEGIVVEIRKDKLLILEQETDFAGQKKNRAVEMKLRSAEQDEKNKGN
jgi:hypothetical protein